MRLFRAVFPCLVSVLAISLLQGCDGADGTSEVQRTASFNEAIMKSKAGYAEANKAKNQKKSSQTPSSKK